MLQSISLLLNTDCFQKVVPESKLEAEVIKTDFSELSNRQKLQLLQKESPEFFNLVEDFKGMI